MSERWLCMRFGALDRAAGFLPPISDGPGNASAGSLYRAAGGVLGYHAPGQWSWLAPAGTPLPVPVNGFAMAEVGAAIVVVKLEADLLRRVLSAFSPAPLDWAMGTNIWRRIRFADFAIEIVCVEGLAPVLIVPNHRAEALRHCLDIRPPEMP